MLRNCALAALLCIGCGGVTPSDPSGQGDAPKLGDGPQADGPPPGLSTETLTCKTNVRTITNANGARTEGRTHFAVVDGVAPTSPFWIESCDLTFTSSSLPNGCPVGVTCTEGGDPFPPGSRCLWTTTGEFVGNKLIVFCGSGSSSFDAAGTMTSSSENRYATVRLHR